MEAEGSLHYLRETYLYILIPISEKFVCEITRTFILTTAAHAHVQIASNMFCYCGHQSGEQFALQTLQDIAF
jgi:hypothetical protein